MALIDTQQLLEPISEAEPAGANLEYDSEFLALERIALGKPEQQMGGTIVPAEPPDYAAMLRQGLQLLGRSKDLRIANHLVRALLQRAGWEGLNEGLGLVQGLLERYWATLHPQLDPDDNNDPTMRITAVAGLCTPDVIATLRTRPLITTRSFGPVSLKDIIAATHDSGGDEKPRLDSAAIEAAFQDVDIEALEGAGAVVKNAVASLRAIEAVFEQEAAGQGPELDPLVDVLRQAQHAVNSRLERRKSGDVAVEESASDGSGNGDASATSSGGGTSAGISSRSGEIRSRDDVVRALDRICAYYAQHEPSSPLPILLQRCKRLVSKSFLEIIRDMAPESVSQVEVIAGRTEDS
jgi:type VI secretion system protein ImpA